MSLAEDIQPSAPRFPSAEAFLAWAEHQPDRWELVDGVARMMTGGSLNHSRLSRNALTALATRLRGGRCEAFGSDAAVIIGSGRVVFPDASVSCEAETGASLARPVVIVEVLSPSTEARDLGEKASDYLRLPSLRHLVFIRQDRVSVRHLHRERPGEDFTLSEIDRVDGRLTLAAIDVEITVAELYAQVIFTG